MYCGLKQGRYRAATPFVPDVTAAHNDVNEALPACWRRLCNTRLPENDAVMSLSAQQDVAGCHIGIVLIYDATLCHE